ncbi:MAG: ABC transporter substrate-binding protein [Cellulosilyticum sp.]|nr:ABC transporter substrate-binding protein [Cellulosilyticum sp.]
MNKVLKPMKLMLLCMMVVAMLVGCTSHVTSDENRENRVDEKTQNGLYPITVTDSYGDEITLEAEVERLISVAPNITEMVYALDAQDKLVGRTDYCTYPEQVAEVESIGAIFPPDIEKIISLEPDLLITSAHFDEESAARLESAGIKVMSLYEEFDVEGVYTMLKTLGVVLNRQEEAQAIIDEMKATIKIVQTKVEGLEKPTVYYVVSYGESGDFSAPENSFVGGLINLAGGKNIVPASDSWFYTLEALLEADPEIIIVRKGEKESFMTAPGYSELTAVKEGKVYEIDSDLLDRQSNRNAEGVLALAKIIHPEAFSQ